MSLRTALSRASLLAVRNTEKSTVRFLGSPSVQAGKAWVKIPKLEMWAMRAFIVTGIMFYPFWVIFHVEEYKRRGNTRSD